MSPENASRGSSQQAVQAGKVRTENSTRVQVSPRSLLQRAQADPQFLTHSDIQQLQRTVGNRATSRLLAQQLSVQTKLTLGPANDKYEQEADRTAQQVVRSLSAPKPPVQRDEMDEESLQAKPVAGIMSPVQRTPLPAPARIFVAPKARPQVVQREELDEELAQASPNHGLEGGDVEPSVAQSIQRAKGGGSELDPKTRTEMEGAFGATFGGVRVHTGAQADTLNRSLNARAFTSGSDIFFRHGEYNPGSSGGKTLLAHELTHTVQQGAAGVQREELDEEIAQATRLGAAFSPIRQSFVASPLLSQVQRNEESAKLLTKLTMPKTFQGPEVELQKQMVELLEEQFKSVDEKELVLFNPSCLGGILLEAPAKWEGSVEGLISTAKLIDLPPQSSKDPKSRAVGKSSFDLAQKAGVEKHIILNTLSTMDKAGQIEYLFKSGLLNDPGWEIVVEIHYYRARNVSQTKLHKDTLGQTLFVNLNYVNDMPIQGPEFIINPALGGKTDEKRRESEGGKSYLEYMQQSLPPEFIKDVETVKEYYGDPTEIGMSEIPAYGVVAFVDETMHHKTPTMGHREISGGSIAFALSKSDVYASEYKLAKEAYDKYESRGFLWKNSDYASYFKNPKLATAEEWYTLLNTLKNSFVKFDRKKIDEMLPKSFKDRSELTEELIETGGNSDFGKASIFYANREDVAVKKKDRPPLKRQMSAKMLTGYEPLVGSGGPRRFFRTWVRAVRK